MILKFKSVIGRIQPVLVLDTQALLTKLERPKHDR